MQKLATSGPGQILRLAHYWVAHALGSISCSRASISVRSFSSDAGGSTGSCRGASVKGCSRSRGEGCSKDGSSYDSSNDGCSSSCDVINTFTSSSALRCGDLNSESSSASCSALGILATTSTCAIGSSEGDLVCSSLGASGDLDGDNSRSECCPGSVGTSDSDCLSTDATRPFSSSRSHHVVGVGQGESGGLTGFDLDGLGGDARGHGSDGVTLRVDDVLDTSHTNHGGFICAACSVEVISIDEGIDLDGRASSCSSILLHVLDLSGSSSGALVRVSRVASEVNCAWSPARNVQVVSGNGIQGGVSNGFVKSTRGCVVSSESITCLSPALNNDLCSNAQVRDDFGFDLVDVLASVYFELYDRALECGRCVDFTKRRSSRISESLSACQGLGRILSCSASSSIGRSRRSNYTALELNSSEVPVSGVSSFPGGDLRPLVKPEVSTSSIKDDGRVVIYVACSKTHGYHGLFSSVSPLNLPLFNTVLGIVSSSRGVLKFIGRHIDGHALNDQLVNVID